MTVNPCYPRGRGAGWSPFSPLPPAGALDGLGAPASFRERIGAGSGEADHALTLAPGPRHGQGPRRGLPPIMP